MRAPPSRGSGSAPPRPRASRRATPRGARRRRSASGPGTRRTSATSPTQPTTGVGGIDAPSVVVVERDVAGDDRDPERLRGLRDPLDRLRELVRDLRLLGIAEVEAVGEADRLTAGARDVARGARASPGRPRGSRRVSPGAGPCSATASPRSDGRRRRTAASRPGRRTVREPTRWSYCSITSAHVELRRARRAAPAAAPRAARPRSAGTRRSAARRGSRRRPRRRGTRAAHRCR